MWGIVDYQMFLLAGILLNLTPGSDTIYILSRSIAQGTRSGIYSSLGISAGCVAHTVLAAMGLSLILSQSALAFMLVKVIGALYLGYLGISALFTKNSAFLMAPAQQASARDTFIQGFFTNLLNPKVALFFISFLPQFIDPYNTYGMLPFLVLGSTFVLTGTLWCFMLVFFSSGITAFLRRRQEASGIMNKICGGIYLLLGGRLLLAER